MPDIKYDSKERNLHLRLLNKYLQMKMMFRYRPVTCLYVELP